MAASIWNPGSQTTQNTPAVEPFQFVPGTAMLPGISFVGDPDTGIWSQAEGYLNFSVNGVTKLVIDSAGNVIANSLVSGVEIDVASAATIDLGGIISNSVRITGTTGITSFGTDYKGPKYIRFSDALTIQNSPTLVCPADSNISIVAGDACIVTPKATAGVADGWVIVSLTKSVSTTGGGATGATGNYVFYENDQVVTGDYTLANGKNAGTFGPVTIADGITVTIPDGATWSIV
jgi:hypothetical protein